MFIHIIDHTVIATLNSKAMSRFIPPSDHVEDIIIGKIPDQIGEAGALRLAEYVNRKSPSANIEIVSVPEVSYGR